MARKSKEFLELFYQDSPKKQPSLAKKTTNKLQRKKEKAAYERFKQRIVSDPDNQNIKFIDNPKHLKKISEVLIDFIQPLLEDTENNEESIMLVEIGIMAWNMSLLPEEQGKTMLQKMLSSDNEQGMNLFKDDDSAAKKEFERLMKKLLKRKLKYFAEEKRFITDFQITENGDNFHLSVASTIPKLTDEIE